MSSSERPARVVGRRLGDYEVTEPLGAGGMGEVYRARDLTLGRDVALKMLPAPVAADPERLARFEREARVLASLNHPNIAAIYGVARTDGVNALVLELVDGETLRDRLRSGPMPIADAIRVAVQLASALEAAHERGIVHRDLKPENVKITPDELVKVLDFGLAKALSGDSSPSALSESPTVTAVATRDGVILGTAGYMSPEQARGKAVDRRTDLWAFGAVVYEMLTGSRTFPGDNVSDTIARILTSEPDWNGLPPGTPVPLRTLLRRCLEKDRLRRLDSATAARLDLEDMLAVSASRSPATSVAAVPRAAWPFATLALAAGAIAGTLATWALLRPAAVPAPMPSQFLIVPAAEQALGVTQGFRDVALSPDGRYLAYHSGPPSGGGQLVIRALDSLDARTLPDAGRAKSPFFSPDSQWIGFIGGTGVKKARLTGGTVITLTSNAGSPAGATWGDKGSIVFAQEEPNSGLLTLPDSGGEPKTLTTVNREQREVAHVLPSFLPDERGVLFTVVGESGKKQVAVLDLRSQQRATLIDGSGAEYVTGVGLVYEASGTLFTVGFDVETLRLVGQPTLLRDSVRLDVRRVPKFAASRNGTIAYVPAAAAVSTLLWVDRKGRETEINAPPHAYTTLQLSPDGKKLAVAINEQEQDIWILDFADDSLRRLTFGRSFDGLPIWMPDGASIVFQSNRAGVNNLFRQAIDGSGAVERLTTSGNTQYPNSVTPDGTTVFGGELAGSTGYDIRRFSVAPGRPADTFLATPAAEYAARVSPDGRFVAYQSTESGRFEIYVQPADQRTQGRWQVSVAGGVAPVWRRNGRELFYLDPSNTLMAVPIEAQRTATFRHGRPAKVFDKQFAGDFYSYDVAPDGNRFVVRRELSQNSAIVVGLNWLQR